MSYNPDEYVTPSWMDEKFFAHALGKFEHDPAVKINSLDFKPATKVGDHFASVMYRVTAEYDIPKYRKTNVKRVMIVKTLPFGNTRKAEMLKDAVIIFQIEGRMYSQVIPEMERLLKNAGDDFKMGPTLIYQSLEPAPVIILEDISLFGYEMIRKPADFDGTLQIAQKLAKFHATSMYINANDMDLTTFSDPLIVMTPIGQPGFLENMIFPAMKGVLESLKKWPDNEIVVEKVEKALKKFIKQMKDVYKGKTEPIYKVLNHGDFHFKNIMVKKIAESESFNDLLVFDYQICLWGTPAIDLSYLLFNMANIDARARREEIIQYYYNEFAATLKKIGFLGKIPSLLDLNLEILKNGVLETYHVFSMILLQFMEFAKENMSEDQSPVQMAAMFHNTIYHPDYQAILKAEIPRMIGLGILACTMSKWLDQEFFTKALRAAYDDPNIEVGQISLRVGTHDGDNYISSVYRSICSYRSQNKITPHLEMIVKLISPKMSPSLQDEVPYHVETTMYKEIVPEIEKLLNESVTPRFLYATKKPYYAIVMEDAYQIGYKVVKIRHELQDTYVIAEKLAKWHAATHFLAKTGMADKMQKVFKRGLLTPDNDGFKFIVNTLDTFIDVTIRWDNFDPFVQKLTSFRSKICQYSKCLYENSKNDKFLVLNHGDLNYHNFLVKYEEGQKNLADVIFIDFQWSIYGTAAIDLYNLLFLVTTDEARACRKQILKHYHSIFTQTLKNIGYSKAIPTLEDLNDELEKYEFLELIMAICVMPFFFAGDINKKENDENAAKFDPELRKKIFQLPEFKKFIIPFLENYFKDCRAKDGLSSTFIIMSEPGLDNCPTIESNWMSDDYFQNVLTSHFAETVKILSTDIKPAAKKGENFASCVYRITLKYQRESSNDAETISLILKTNSSNAAVQEVIEEFQVFERELTTYKEVLVECEKLLNSHGETLNFSPFLVFADADSLVFEDATAKGYATIDRRNRLDLEHCKLFLAKLAKFHAATAVLYKKNPDFFRYHMQGGLTEMETPYHVFFRTVISEFLNTVVKKEASLEPFIDVMTEFAENIIENMKKIFTRTTEEFHVQNHGDAWMNNMLWKNDENGKLCDLLVIDHQEGFYGSPGIDLNHFINTSCNLEVQKNHVKELIEHYHEALSAILTKLGAKFIPSVEDIFKAMRSKVDHGIIVTACILPLMLIEDTDLADPNNFFIDTEETREARFKIYTNPKYVEIVREILPKLIKIKQTAL
ncbi:uncharacterized protein LOC134837698 [Culicoides brevitarsis]|uniref:uncharacterized protein LOC134837698 n=1 Tax=Culicoides brevitarsis TaxID=469753 RepID=UPI00307C1B3D